MKKTTVAAKWPFEIICWIDHGEPIDKRSWDGPTPPEQLRPIVVWTGGFIVSENDQIVEQARDTSEYGHTSASINIIKKCIVYRKRIAVPTIKRAQTDI